MNLKLSKKGNLIITERTGVEVYVNTSDVDETGSEDALYAGFKGKGFDRPGEFESNDIFVISLEKRKQNVGIPNVFKVNYSEIGVLVVVDDFTDPNKSELDLMGEVDILILNSKAMENGVESLVRKINPHSVILLDDSGVERLSKDLNMQVGTTESNFKFSLEDFAEEGGSTNLLVFSQ